MDSIPMRDAAWLEDRVSLLWNLYYKDAPRGYPIHSRFGRKAQYRYGSIYSRGDACIILINGLFAHPDVPVFVVDATIVHELAHYVHGYGSGLHKLHSSPHKGSVVENEMRTRGCYSLEEQAMEWRRRNWQEFYCAQASASLEVRDEKTRRTTLRWQMYLNSPGFRTNETIKQRLVALCARFGLEDPPFDVQWLLASVRRNGLSYRFMRENVVRLHGTLADTVVPDEVVDYELAYWLAVDLHGGSWRSVERGLREAGIWTRAQKAIKWRRNVWPKYYLANHPLADK